MSREIWSRRSSSPALWWLPQRTSLSRVWKLSRKGLVAMLVAVACTKGDSGATHRADSALPIVAASDTGTKDNCPVTGLWSQCLLFKRLERMGLTFHPESLTD